MSENINEQNILAQEAAKREKYEQRLKEKRRKRDELSSSGLDDPFALPQELLDPRFKYVIVNDKGNAISKKMAWGYEVVEDPAISKAMGLTEKGPVKFSTGMSDPKWAILMRIERELYDEDRERVEQRAIDQYKQLEAVPEGLKFAKSADVSDLNLDKSKTIDQK